MERIDTDKYLVLIRDDYLYELSKRSKNRQKRDILIQKAVEDFLGDNYTFEQRRDMIREEEDRVNIMFPADYKPDYHMYIESVHLPDDLVGRMDKKNRDDFDVPIYEALGTVLNAAIRAYLKKECPDHL